MTNQEKKQIKTLLDYMWADEETHYQALPRKDHIFVILKSLAKRIGYKAT